MLHTLRAPLLLGLLVACACKSGDTTTVTPEAAAHGGADADGGSAASRSAPAGVAHSASIDLVVLDPTGQAALTRDSVGGLRLWPALDGSLEPQPVPIAAPRSMAVLPVDDGFVVLGVEASGGARFVAVQPDGHAKDLTALPPFNPVLEVAALHGERGPRFVALMRDGAIRVFDPAGEELLVFDEKGFQPMSVRPTADGEHLISLTAMDRVGSDARAEAQRLSFGGSAEAPTLTRTGVPQILSSTAGMTETTVVVAPDGGEISVLARPVSDHWNVDVYDLGKDAKPREIEVKFAIHQQPHLGYTGPRRLLVSSNEGTPSRLIDTASDSVRLRTSIPQDFNHQGRAQDSAAGRQIVAYGTFLFVHDVDARRHRFLGYEATQSTSVGISPSGAYVAWAYGQGPIVVEPTDGEGRAVEVDYGNANFAGTRVRFLDDEHLVIVDAVGEVSLVNWKTQDVLARAGTMSSVRAVHLDPQQGLFVLERHTNEAWIFEVSVEDGFAGPYIVGDSYRLGILRPAPPSDVVLWSVQASNNKIREFTLDQLRADLTVAEADALGVELAAGQPPPMAVDSLGRHYGVRWNGTALEMFVRRGADVVASRAMSTNDINQILPAPGGDHFLGVFNRSGSISVAMHETEGLETLWSYSTGIFANDTAWSDDGRYVALSANTGAILLDATSGEPVLTRCGLQFKALGAPPSNAFAAPNQKSICEL